MNAPAAADSVELALEGMTCAACAARIEKSLNRLGGVRANVNFAAETAHVAFPQGEVTVEALIDTVRRAGYDARVQELLFGAEHEIVTSGRAITAQTPGGTGSLRVAADFLKKHFPVARIWCSKPTWANHQAIFQAAGLATETYAYLDAAGTGLDYAAMLSAVQKIPAGDVILLHACCQNPTGIDGIGSVRTNSPT